jgi:putative flippase GtrA
VTVAPLGVRSRYLIVGFTCAVLHNAILIGLDRLSVHYTISSAVSFVVVVQVGYLMHTTLTYRAPRGLSSFARYALAMSANYPLIVALLFLMVTLGRLPVAIASPAGTVILFGWNFVTSRWAIVRRSQASIRDAAGSATDGDPPAVLVEELMGRHIGLYRRRRPAYQTVLLQSLRSLWDSGDRSVLDVGGGSGLLAQGIHDFFPVERIVSVDVKDRFLPNLSIEIATYDGSRLPFSDATFDCVLLSNVLHHVPQDSRLALIKECARATGCGRLYIKDHLAMNVLDRARLTLLDFVGNAPFGGMVRATYMSPSDWTTLATSAGYRVETQMSGAYRDGLLSRMFPNRMEITMLWVKNN